MKIDYKDWHRIEKCLRVVALARGRDNLWKAVSESDESSVLRRQADALELGRKRRLDPDDTRLWSGKDVEACGFPSEELAVEAVLRLLGREQFDHGFGGPA